MPRKAVGIYVDVEVDRRLGHLAVDTGMSKSELYELGARTLLKVVLEGRRDCLPHDAVKLVEYIKSTIEKGEA